MAPKPAPAAPGSGPLSKPARRRAGRNWPANDAAPLAARTEDTPRPRPDAVTPGLAPAAAGPAKSRTRLTRRAEFLHVAAKGRKTPMPGMVLQVLKRPDQEPVRLGFTVTKKVGNSVVRNRTKRRLREAARLLLRDTPVVGADLVLIGRDKTRARPFAALMDDLRQALARHGLPANTP